MDHCRRRQVKDDCQAYGCRGGYYRETMCQNQPDKALKMIHWQACGAEHLGDRCQTGCAHLCSCVDRVLVRGEEMDDDDDDDQNDDCD